MARSNPKALNIAVVEIPLDSPTFVKFREKGHQVYGVESEDYRVLGYDVIIGPRCWRIDPHIRLGDDATDEESLKRQLGMMEKGVRARKHPKEKKETIDTKTLLREEGESH